MGLFKRISDIVSANLNEMVDSFEDPELMLKQAVREMEESIREATSETAKVLANEKKVAKELAHNQNEAQLWQARAEKAVEADDDELARKALARKRDHEKLVVALEDQLTSAKQASDTLRHQLDAMKAKLAEAKRSLATLAARKKAAEVRKNAFAEQGACETKLEKLEVTAFDKFERMREKVEQAEAEAEALAELRAGDIESDLPFGHLNVDAEVEAELQALKNKKQNQ